MPLMVGMSSSLCYAVLFLVNILSRVTYFLHMTGITISLSSKYFGCDYTTMQVEQSFKLILGYRHRAQPLAVKTDSDYIL